MCFASNLHMEIGKIIENRKDPNILGFYNFGSYFASPSGKIHVRKNAPKTKNGMLKKYEVL